MSALTDGVKAILERELDLDIIERFEDVDKDDKKLEAYLTFKAKKELNSKSGGLPDDMVVGWARHFYLESDEVISKEMKPDTPVSPPTKVKTPEELQAEREAKEKRKANADAELKRLNEEQPFMVHKIDPITYEIKSEKPVNKVNKDENQLGLFDL